MKPIIAHLLSLGLLIGFATVLTPDASAKEVSLAELEPLVAQGVAKWKTVKDYTAIFIKQENVKGDLLEKETCFMKHRIRPRSVYMKWNKDPHEGRETLFVKGKNDDEIKAHEGGIIGVVNVTLDPYGRMARSENRHAVYEAGIGTTVDLISADIKTAR